MRMRNKKSTKQVNRSRFRLDCGWVMVVRSKRERERERGSERETEREKERERERGHE